MSPSVVVSELMMGGKEKTLLSTGPLAPVEREKRDNPTITQDEKGETLVSCVHVSIVRSTKDLFDFYDGIESPDTTSSNKSHSLLVNVYLLGRLNGRQCGVPKEGTLCRFLDPTDLVHR